MKQSTYLSSLVNGAKKVFFCSQIFIISLSLPSLFYVGITYNSDSAQKKNMILTNKGKKYLADEEKSEMTIKYSPAFLKI